MARPGWERTDKKVQGLRANRVEVRGGRRGGTSLVLSPIVHWKRRQGEDHGQVEESRIRENPPVSGWIPWDPRADLQELSTYSGAPCSHHAGQMVDPFK